MILVTGGASFIGKNELNFIKTFSLNKENIKYVSDVLHEIR